MDFTFWSKRISNVQPTPLREEWRGHVGGFWMSPNLDVTFVGNKAFYIILYHFVSFYIVLYHCISCFSVFYTASLTWIQGISEFFLDFLMETPSNTWGHHCQLFPLEKVEHPRKLEQQICFSIKTSFRVVRSGKCPWFFVRFLGLPHFFMAINSSTVMKRDPVPVSNRHIRLRSSTICFWVVGTPRWNVWLTNPQKLGWKVVGIVWCLVFLTQQKIFKDTCCSLFFLKFNEAYGRMFNGYFGVFISCDLGWPCKLWHILMFFFQSSKEVKHKRVVSQHIPPKYWNLLLLLNTDIINSHSQQPRKNMTMSMHVFFIGHATHICFIKLGNSRIDLRFHQKICRRCPYDQTMSLILFIVSEVAILKATLSSWIVLVCLACLGCGDLPAKPETSKEQLNCSPLPTCWIQ